MFVNAGIAEYKDQFFNDELDVDGKLKEPDRRVLNVDMDAASDTTKLAIHYLRKNKEGGAIVMTASLAGYLASAGAPLYSAAKHGKSYPIWKKIEKLTLLCRHRRPHACPQTRMCQSQYRHIRCCPRYNRHPYS